MSDSSPENFSYFANIAESYDRIQPVLSPPYARGLEMIVDLIPFEPGEPFEFVDLGCGTAEPTARVLERFRRATGTCIDSEPEMLRLAKRKLTPYSGRIEVREADITGCAVPSCDVVFSGKTVHHVHPRPFVRAICADRGRAAADRLFHPLRHDVDRPRLGSGSSFAIDALPRASYHERD